MPNFVNMKLNGLDRTIQALKSLPLKIRKKTVKKVMTSEASQLRKSVRSVTPVKTGTLKKAITTNQEDYTRRADQSGDIIASVGVALKSPAIKYYKQVYNNSKTGHHFLDKGYDEWVAPAEERIQKKFKDGINEIISGNNS